MSMKKLHVILLFLLGVLNLQAKKATIDFTFPDSLARNANAVVLFSQTVYERTTLSDLTEQVHYALTILNDHDEDLWKYSIFYDQFTEVDDLECNIYDKDGKKVRTLKKSEIRDYAAFSSYTLFQDDRYKYFQTVYPDFPYTVEVSYQIRHDGFLALPVWYPIADYKLGIKESEVTIIYPDNLKIDYKEINSENLEFIRQQEKGRTTLKWSLKNAVPLEYEKYAPPFTNQVPAVYLSPVRFKYDKSTGEFSDWSSLGTWNYQLFDEGKGLGEETIQELSKIKEQAKDSVDLIKKVYQYLQSKTRYVGVQLGIGGFKPIPPDVVDAVGYGDCKALSFYTKELLREVGVDARYAVVGIDNKRIRFDQFVSVNQINHAIICVPMAKDTVWLECTSQLAPFNHLMDGTTGRKALLITANGGELVSTPAIQPGMARKNTVIHLNTDGSVDGKIQLNYIGAFFDDHYFLKSWSDKELREYVLKNTEISDMKIKSLNVECSNDSLLVKLNNCFTTNNLVTKSGTRWFIGLAPFAHTSKISLQKKERRNSVYIRREENFEDKLVFEIPADFKTEYFPENKSIQSDFGTFTLEATVSGKKLIIEKHLKIFAGKYGKEHYPEYIDFINKVADIETAKVILNRN